MKAQHGPLSNIYVLLSLLGILIGISLWSLTPEWGFLFLLMSILVFIATFVSAVRSPLPTDHDIELAIHERYRGGRYPDTNLHSGLVKKGHKTYISKHKKHLVKWHLATTGGKEETIKSKKKSAQEAVVAKGKKKVVSPPKKVLPKKKSAVKKVQPKKSAKSTAKKTTKKTNRR